MMLARTQRQCLAATRASCFSSTAKRCLASWTDGIPMGPADPILGLSEQFAKDTFPQKISLGVGAYRDDNGKPYVLDSVMEAEKVLMAQKENKEYAGIAGIAPFVKLSLEFAYGKDSLALAEGRVAGVQALSGTGACRLAGEFYKRFVPGIETIYVPSPTWGNHHNIFRDAGLPTTNYTYYDGAGGLDFGGMLKSLNEAPDGSLVMLHACAHNPTGVDPTLEQWAEISSAMKAKDHIAFFDCAYQGFASGDADKDAAALRMFVADGHSVMLAQSYAKNFGLYGERIGCLSMVCKDADEMERVLSQLKILIRPAYSNPPIHGAHIVKTILSDPVLEKQWYAECKGMADRIISMRTLLTDKLAAAGSTKDWGHINSQIGMFAFSGLTKDQVDTLRTEHHIYMTGDGRISMAGVTTANVEYLASCMHEVTK
eukprot:SAG22_NODE_1667_length_3851_cov_1.673774_1_plen_428_part_00